MWSILPKNELQNFNSKYMNDFEDLIENLILSENDSYYFFPRHFHKNYPFLNLKQTQDKQFLSKNIEIEFTADLRDEQKILIDRVKNIYEKTGTISGIIKARPGFGKTVCASYICSLLKLKTLIILDNSKLSTQWKSEFLKFTNIKEEDIGIIQGAAFTAKPVTITMVQTLTSKCKNKNTNFYKKIRDEGFGLIIFDEVHKTSSAPKFATSSLLLNSPNILGLSATPFGDNLHQLFMKNIIGNVIFESGEYELKPKVHFICYDSELGSAYNINRLRYTSDYIKQVSYYNSIIHKSNVYLEVIGKICKNIIKDERRGIVIVQTLNQLNTIIDYLATLGIRATPLQSEKQDIDKVNDNLIVATYKMASHGFDYAALSALVLATPLKGRVSLIQTVGRILRLFADKKHPLVFDLIDTGFGDLFSKNIATKKNILEEEFKNCIFTRVNYEKSSLNY